MPTTYAHWRFGCDCIETMPEELKKVVNEHRALFDLGVHGPDIFFYDLAHPALPRYGSAMHHEAARNFFEKAVEIYKNNDEDKDAMLAYILGFLSHFTLDSQAHGYVDRKKEVSGFSHNKIEAEFDGHLMRKDGRSVSLTDRAASLKPDKETSRIIARFFPFSEKEILRTTRMQHLIISALNCRNNFKRKIINGILRTLHLDDNADLIVYPEEGKGFADANMRLDKLMNNARALYPKLLKELLAALNEDKELPAYFDHNFEPWPDYQQIPVLTAAEEKTYIPELRL